MYGILLGAILFYQKLSKQLADWRITTPALSTKQLNGEQVTVQLYVDDLKISHKDQNVLVLKDLNAVNDKSGTKKQLV